MTEYPYELSELSSGAFKLEFPDFPSLQLFGKSHYVLRLEAASMLNAFLSIRIRKGLKIPHPTLSANAIRIEEHIDFRLNLHWSMQNCGISRQELADDLGLSLTMVENLLDGELEEGTPFVEVVAMREIGEEVDHALTKIIGDGRNVRTAEIALLAV